MAGSLYIWIMLGFFVLVVGCILLLMGAIWIGHLIEKRETGATHGFLELPVELRPKSTDGDTPSIDPENHDSAGSTPPPTAPSA